MQGLCGGNLEPYIYVEPQKFPGKPTNILYNHQARPKKLEPIPMCDLMKTLFPSEAAVFQCSMCGKLIPNSMKEQHKCERNDISILSINYHRESYNRYLCSSCFQIVHSAFLYTHADIHNHPDTTPINRSEIVKLASIIIHNDSKPPTKELRKKTKNRGENINNSNGSGNDNNYYKGNRIANMSKDILNSLNLSEKKGLPCLNSPLTDSRHLPIKRNRTINVADDSD